MATIKLKKPGADARRKPETDRPPVRGAQSGFKGARPTLAQAQAQRAEREARYQEQLRQRFGDRPPEGFVRRDRDAGADRPTAPRASPRRADAYPPSRPANTAFAQRAATSPPPPPHDSRSAPPTRNTRSASQRDAFARPERDMRDSRDPRQTRERVDPRQLPPQPPQRDSRLAPPARAPERDPRGRFDARDARDTRDAHGARNAPSQPPARFDPRPPPRRQPPASRRPTNDDDDHFEHREHEPGSMRLSKRMSELGIASRREADEWIAKGYVRVDDRIVSELGSRVMPDQRVTIDAKAKFMQAQRVTVLVNKPVGYVSGQAEDGYEPAVVLVTPDNQWRDDRSGTRFLREHLKSLVPAGRLDIDSVGLLVLTQDGRIAKQLIGEETEIEKEYLVRVASIARGGLSDAGLALLRHGLELDGEALRPAEVEWVNDDQLRFVLSQGKKRQIRRMCDAVGLQVLGLKRVRVGKVMLGDLPPGHWRYLRADEAFA
jgi:23S rRNA pseudouridine2604 synthase